MHPPHHNRCERVREESMKAFLVSVAVALFVAIGAFYVLGAYQILASDAYSVPVSVRI
jgi:hypothetical protein